MKKEESIEFFDERMEEFYGQYINGQFVIPENVNYKNIRYDNKTTINKEGRWENVKSVECAAGVL